MKPEKAKPAQTVPSDRVRKCPVCYNDMTIKPGSVHFCGAPDKCPYWRLQPTTIRRKDA